MIRLIYAATEDRVIGSRGRLPWHIPDELKHFKETTIGGVVIMGYNTWASLPGKQKPLKNRTNIVLSTNTTLKLPGAIVYHSLNSALADYSERDIWIIGGSKVLKQAIKINEVEEIRLTLILTKILGDSHSPVIDIDEWKLISKSEIMESGNIKYQYLNYKRIR